MSAGGFKTTPKVLVIDDQKTMRSIMRDLLAQVGIEDVDEAGDGAVALKLLRDPEIEFPDLIICDLHMEKMDGMQFCNAVRRDDDLRDRRVPIIMLTGDHDTFLHEVAKQVGAVRVVTKPITAAELKAVVHDQMGAAFLV